MFNFQGLDLRVEHTHGLNKGQGQGGHYHYDTTPEEIEYVGYFGLAERKYLLLDISPSYNAMILGTLKGLCMIVLERKRLDFTSYPVR